MGPKLTAAEHDECIKYDLFVSYLGSSLFRRAWLNKLRILHRIEGPAYEMFNELGGLISYGWYLNGKVHNDKGPAVLNCMGDKSYYLNGVEYSEKEFNLEVSAKNNFTPNVCQTCNTINEYADSSEAIFNCWNCR